MAKGHANVCPGCSRHCPMGKPHCKYGQKYFEKLKEKEASGENQQESRPKYKWEKFVRHEGALWKLLLVSGRSKKALKKGKLTEAAILSPLDEDEQEQLMELLGKLSETLG